MECENDSLRIELVELCRDLFERIEIGQEIGITRDIYQRDGRAGLFELGRQREAGQAGRKGESNERGRDVEFVEGTRHRVLAADGGEAQRVLGVERT